MTKPRRPAAPKGLDTAGKALWRQILADLDAGWELDARELCLLERACRCADELAALESAVDRDGPTTTGSRGQTTVHPALSEARQLRIVQLRLLAAIEVADPKARSATPAQARARKAAESRWGGLMGRRVEQEPRVTTVEGLHRRHSALRRALLESIPLDSPIYRRHRARLMGLRGLTFAERLAAEVDSYKRALREAEVR